MISILFPEDYELWLRWLEAGVRMEKLMEPRLVWHDSPARLSRRDPRYADHAFYRIKGGYLARSLLDHGVRIQAFVDIDPRRIGRRLHGVPVLGPDALPPAGDAFVVSTSGAPAPGKRSRHVCKGAGYRLGIDYILAA